MLINSEVMLKWVNSLFTWWKFALMIQAVCFVSAHAFWCEDKERSVASLHVIVLLSSHCMYSITAWWVLSHNESGLADAMQCLIPTLLFKDNLDIHIFCHIFLYFLLKECRIKNTWKPQSSHVRPWTHQTVFITSMYPDL